MSTLKRKGAPSANTTTKDVKPANDARPSKKAKSEKPAKSGDHKSSKTTEKPVSSTPAITTLKDEEPLFPRGGGSVLTPLEHKQITIEAKRDALFEDETAKSEKKGDKDSKKKKRKSTGKEGKKSDKAARDEDAVRIEGLNYKVCSMQLRNWHS